MDIIIIGKAGRKKTDAPHVIYCGQSRTEAAEAVKDTKGKFPVMYQVSGFPIAPVKDVTLSEAGLAREAAALETERKNNEEVAAAERAKRLAEAKLVLVRAQNEANEAQTVAEQCRKKGITSSAGDVSKLKAAVQAAEEAVAAIEEEIAEAAKEPEPEEKPEGGADLEKLKDAAVAARAKADAAGKAAVENPSAKMLKALEKAQAKADAAEKALADAVEAAAAEGK